jgi:hypothetical protein
VTTDGTEPGGQPARSQGDVVDAASRALGRPLTDPVALQEGSWTLVLRCRDAASGPVIVKAFPPDAEGASSFAAEAAGLGLATGTGLSPDLLAVDRGQLAVVMADLGTAGSLADLLLGDSAPAARAGLLTWAAGCGQLAAARAGQQAEFDRLRAGYAGDSAGDTYWTELEQRVREAAERAGLLGVTAPAGLAGELAIVAAAVSAQQYPVFSPGDICPDNNLVTADGIRFVDFESAGFHSVFLDAAYLRMPFSTCWCVFRLPAEVAASTEAAYRQEVTAQWPELADDTIWQGGVRRAVAAWTMSSMWWLLGRALKGDESLNPEVAVAPHARQLMRHRWQVLAADLETAGEYPALAALARSLLTATTGWQAPDLPLYPAFR